MTTTTKDEMNHVAEATAAPIESHLHPTPSWNVADHPLPTGREEVWRFTPVRRLKPVLTDAPSDACLSWDEVYPAGVLTAVLSPADARALAAEPPLDRVAALAAAHAGGAQLIDVPAETELDDPVLVTLRGGGDHVWGQIVVRIGHHARATIVLRHEGTGSYATKIDVVVGDSAQVHVVMLQDWDDDAVHAGQISYLVGRDASVRTINVTLGGSVVRLAETARFAGPGGSIEQLGLYFVDAGQHVEHRLFVDHNEPHTSSNVDFRGALQGQDAHSVWVGDVLIRKEAEGIETYESNKNLVLTEGARADSVPNLEIETGKIAGAGHSSTTGRFDDEHLFYLMSRGIDEVEAKRLVVRGFFQDIIRRVGVASIEQRLNDAVEAELEVAVGALR